MKSPEEHKSKEGAAQVLNKLHECRSLGKNTEVCTIIPSDYLLFLLLLWLYSPLLGLGRFFSFLITYTVGRTPWTGFSLSQGRYLYTEQ
jgi:hypothetical protein